MGYFFPLCYKYIYMQYFANFMPNVIITNIAWNFNFHLCFNNRNTVYIISRNVLFIKKLLIRSAIMYFYVQF